MNAVAGAKIVVPAILEAKKNITASIATIWGPSAVAAGGGSPRPFQVLTLAGNGSERNQMLPVGSIFDGRYEILEHIGEGGFGGLYKARHPELSRLVALKVMLPELFQDERSRARFKREGRALAEMMHPNIVRFYDFGLSADHSIPYIVMEFLDGESLRQLISRTGKLTPAVALNTVINVLEALSCAHEHGLVHRDIKPGNIMMMSDDGSAVKLVDFGLARVLENSKVVVTRANLTENGVLIGSVNYMSPEQCLGRKADFRADLYSVGCVLYECVFGCVPFDADTAMGVLNKHVREELPSFERVGQGLELPRGLEFVLRKAMAKEVESRYQSAQEMKAALEMVARGEGKRLISLEEKGKPIPVRKSSELSDNTSANVPKMLLAVLAALLVCGIVGFMIVNGKSSTSPSSSTVSSNAPHAVDPERAVQDIKLDPVACDTATADKLQNVAFWAVVPGFNTNTSNVCLIDGFGNVVTPKIRLQPGKSISSVSLAPRSGSDLSYYGLNSELLYGLKSDGTTKIVSLKSLPWDLAGTLSGITYDAKRSRILIAGTGNSKPVLCALEQTGDWNVLPTKADMPKLIALGYNEQRDALFAVPQGPSSNQSEYILQLSPDGNTVQKRIKLDTPLEIQSEAESGLQLYVDDSYAYVLSPKLRGFGLTIPGFISAYELSNGKLLYRNPLPPLR